MMNLEGKTVLVLGGAGLVGTAVCHQLLEARPARIAIAARRRNRAEQAVQHLRGDFGEMSTALIPMWGDVFLRAEWQCEGSISRTSVLEDTEKRRNLIADILDPLDRNIIEASLLSQMIEGRLPSLDGEPTQIVLDCMNTATAVSYQNIYTLAHNLAKQSANGVSSAPMTDEIETLLASLYVPQLVRHIQLLHEAMRRAGTLAYIKVGTTGTGGMGLNIPYTHGEERPSRLLLSKAALAGAQSLLTFLMARTPGGPQIVKEVKPAAVIGWREIAYGPVRSHGRDIPLYDCLPDQAVSISDKAGVIREGEFGLKVEGMLEGVYIDTGENGQFSCGEFTAITALGQMELVTPEEIAHIAIQELEGGNTGRDVVDALDSAVVGPSYRGGFLREAAISRLRQMENQYGESVAFEILGPPRLSKLLFEAYLLKHVGGTITEILAQQPDVLSRNLEAHVLHDRAMRTRMISIGIPILLSDGERLLRGPLIKAADACQGWVDLTPTNAALWQARLMAIREMIQQETSGDASSHHDRNFEASRRWLPEQDSFDTGEVVAWIFNTEEKGRRGKR